MPLFDPTINKSQHKNTSKLSKYNYKLQKKKTKIHAVKSKGLCIQCHSGFGSF